MSGIISAAGLALNAFNIQPNIGWKWVALIGFIFFVAIVWQGWSASEYRARRYEHTKPNLKLDKIHEHQLFATENNGEIKQGDAVQRVLQIWFKNKPLVPTDDSVAKQVTATVTFYNRDTKEVIEAPGCCFVIAEAFDYAGNTGKFLDTIDEWPPNDEPRKLQIAVKAPNSESAYVFARPLERLDREIKKGTYYVKVHLTGTRVERALFWFILDNPGKAIPFSLNEIIKKPNLRREGFQTE